MSNTNTSTNQSWVIDTEVEDFLLARQVQGVVPGTIVWHKHCLGKWRAYCIEHGVGATEQTTPKLLRAFVAQLQADGHNEGGITNIYRSVKAFLRWYENEVEPPSWRSPTRKVKISVSKPPLLEPVSLGHFRAMVATCDTGAITDSRDLAILYLLLDSGVRHQELTDLSIGDVDFSTGEILIRHGKGGKTRIVFVGATARQALGDYLQVRNGSLIRYLRRRNNIPESDALWLTDKGSPLTKAGIRQVIRRRTIQAGVPEYGLHAFRRAFAINSLRNGMDVITLQRLMGHSSLEVTTRYLKFVTNDLATAHAKFGVIDTIFHKVEHSDSSASPTVLDALRGPGYAANVEEVGAAQQVSTQQDKEQRLAKQKQSAVKNKEKHPTKRKASTAQAKKKHPPKMDYTVAVSEGKRPARLH